MLFPTKPLKKILMPVVAILTGFIINGIRVAMLAILAGSNQKMFEYWHTDKGEIFSIVSVLIFALLFWISEQF
ncbi:MAG: archaeosortase/exosortase family protein [Chroococcidiopsidaceae cyanobacterium CP_BM_RX_35]|nr:archaeosortase/exosortase family protein [Chroococcidiopsidaceae cyanobacterium CP_BM_RX_35]